MKGRRESKGDGSENDRRKVIIRMKPFTSNIPDFIERDEDGNAKKTFSNLEALKIHRDNRAQEIYLQLLRDSEKSIKELESAIAYGMKYDKPFVPYPNLRKLGKFKIYESTDFQEEGLSNGNGSFISFEEIITTSRPFDPLFFKTRLVNNKNYTVLAEDFRERTIFGHQTYYIENNDYDTFDVIEIMKSKHEPEVARFYLEKDFQFQFHKLSLINDELYYSGRTSYEDPYNIKMSFLSYVSDSDEEYTKQYFITHANSFQPIDPQTIDKFICGRTRKYGNYYFNINPGSTKLSVYVDSSVDDFSSFNKSPIG
jgi:hypothetical protein